MAYVIKKALIFSAFFCASNILLAQDFNCPPPRIDETATVDYVYDGDTLKLQDGRKLRLIGIDTPELHSRKRSIDEREKRQGEAARAALVDLLKAVDNRISIAYGVERYDRYNRTLAHVYLSDGTSVQAWLIDQGYGIAFTTPPNDRMSSCYRQQENDARKSKRGIWSSRRFQAKSVAELDSRSRGFHIVRARVTDIWQGRKSVTLLLDNQLKLTVHQSDLKNFNHYMLQNLKGKKVQVRGWLRVQKSKSKQQAAWLYMMTLRHSDSISLQK